MGSLFVQGTLAKSGTSEFLAKADSLDTTNSGNLIGAFGVGFYSRCLLLYFNVMQRSKTDYFNCRF